MAPRKRRGRSSATLTQRTLQSASASNSAATSPHSSPLPSKSDLDSQPSLPLAERNSSEANPQSRKLAVISHPVSSPRHSSKTDATASTPHDQSRDPSLPTSEHVVDQSMHAEGSDKEPTRDDNLLSAFEDAIAQNGAHMDHFTTAAVAVHLYNDMINWAISHVAVQFKRSVFLASEANRYLTAIDAAALNPNDPPGTNPERYGSKLLYSDKNVNVECSNCGSSVSASRYAQHFEKCLGRGGRMSSRAASARLRASAERAEKEDAAELDEAPSRRRRSSSADPADTGFAGGSYAKRRKMSPVPSGGSASASQGGSMQHGRGGLPPSGRTRSSPP